MVWGVPPAELSWPGLRIRPMPDTCLRDYLHARLTTQENELRRLLEESGNGTSTQEFIQTAVQLSEARTWLEHEDVDARPPLLTLAGLLLERTDHSLAILARAGQSRRAKPVRS